MARGRKKKTVEPIDVKAKLKEAEEAEEKKAPEKEEKTADLPKDAPMPVVSGECAEVIAKSFPLHYRDAQGIEKKGAFKQGDILHSKDFADFPGMLRFFKDELKAL